MKIGVIGGNGVAATNRLCEMVERKITAAGAFRDAHHPEMVVWQATSAPSRSMFLEGRGPDWRPDYIRIARQLKSIGCDIGCMCCNTAHYAVGEIESASGISFINLLDEVAKRVRTSGLGKVEMWVSDGARKFDIYRRAFEVCAPGVEMVYPSEERQAEVTKAICAVKTKARFGNVEADGHPKKIIRRLLRGAAVPVVLGCTDLRVAYCAGEAMDDGIALDSLECLADAIVSLTGGGGRPSGPQRSTERS